MAYFQLVHQDRFALIIPPYLSATSTAATTSSGFGINNEQIAIAYTGAGNSSHRIASSFNGPLTNFGWQNRRINFARFD